MENNYYVQDTGNTYVDQGNAGGMWGDSGLASGGMDYGGGMDTSAGW